MPQSPPTAESRFIPTSEPPAGAALHDAVRLAALRETGLLDGTDEPPLDRLTRLATRLLGARTALVSLVDADRQCFASAAGLAEPWASARQTPLSHSFCQHVVTTAGPLVVRDAREHPHLRDNLAIRDLDVVAYAGFPLVTPEGRVLGSFCVIDGCPREWTADELETLEELTQSAASEIALRVAGRRLAAQAEELAKRSAELAELHDVTADLVFAVGADGRFTFVNRAWQAALDYTAAAAAELRADDVMAPADRGRFAEAVRRLLAGGPAEEFLGTFVARGGGRVVCRCRLAPVVRETADGPRCVGVGAIGRDVMAEEAARAQHARLLAMLEVSADFVATATAEGHVVYLNATARATLGLPAGVDVTTVRTSAFHPPAVLAELRAGALPAAVRDGRWTGETVLCGAGGRRIPVSMVLVWHPPTRPGEPGHFSTVVRDLSERAAAATALERERAFLAATLESLSDGVVACDASGRLTLFNRATREFHGVPDEPLPPTAWADRYGLFRADGTTPLPTEEIPLVRAFDGEEVRDAEIVIVSAAGGTRLVRASGRPIRDSAGERLGAVVAMRDVTEQQRAESALRESETRYRALVEMAPDAVLVHAGGRVRYANPAAAGLLGAASSDALVGAPVLDLVQPGEGEGSVARVWHELEDDVVAAPVERRLRRGDGTVIHCEVAGAAVLYDGAPAVQVIARDVTARRHAVEALRASEARFRAALEGGQFGFVVLAPVRDASGTVVDFDVASANEQAAALVDMPREDLVGQRVGELLPIARDSGHLAVYAGVLETGQARELDVRATDPRFTVEWLRVHAVRLRVDGVRGQPDGVALMLRDVSALKRAEREVRLLTDVTHALAAAKDLPAAARAALAAMCAATRWEYGDAWFVQDPDTEEERLVHTTEWDAGSGCDPRIAGFASASRGWVFRRGEGLPGMAWRDGAPVIAPRLDAPDVSFPRLAHAHRAGLRSGIAVPVLADGRVIAVLCFYTRDRRRADKPPVALLATVAAQASGAMQRKLAEAALAAREARLELIYNSSTDLMFLMRLERGADGAVTAYRCESVNEAYLAVTGLTRAALIGRTVEEILPPPAAEFVLGKYALAERTGEVLRYDEAVDLPTGRVVVETTLTPVRDDAGRCAHLLGVARDVSATRRAEAALRESESLFRGVLENVRAPAVQLDTEGRVTFANDALLALTGATYAETLGADWFARFVPDDPGLRARFQAGIAAGALAPNHESDLATLDGARRTVAWDDVLLRDADGRVTGSASIGQDVTERRALEARLAALSEHDELTGLLNRRGFRRAATQALRSVGRTQRHDAVLYVDLDGFKPINDAHGHAAGDAALRAVAGVIRDTLRDEDVPARIGGDEFAVYAVGLHPGAGRVLAARLQQQLAAHNAAAAAAGRPFAVAFSVGVAELQPGDDLDALLARADAELYERKLAHRR